MSAKIIAIANQKGGSGKTTVSMTLAGTLGMRGFRVLVVDADAQGTATQYAASAPDDAPFPATVSGLSAAGNKIHREVRKQVEDYDIIIIDCPPAVDSVIPQSALLVSDLVIVPVVPSPADLWAALGMRELVARIEVINEDLRGVLLANSCQPQARITQAVMEQLDEFGMPLLKSRMHNRTAFRQAMAFGVPVQTLGAEAKKAADEADRLADEVIGLLKKPAQKKEAEEAEYVEA